MKNINRANNSPLSFFSVEAVDVVIQKRSRANDEPILPGDVEFSLLL